MSVAAHTAVAVLIAQHSQHTHVLVVIRLAREHLMLPIKRSSQAFQLSPHDPNVLLCPSLRRVGALLSCILCRQTERIPTNGMQHLQQGITQPVSERTAQPTAPPLSTVHQTLACVVGEPCSQRWCRHEHGPCAVPLKGMGTWQASSIAAFHHGHLPPRRQQQGRHHGCQSVAVEGPWLEQPICAVYPGKRSKTTQGVYVAGLTLYSTLLLGLAALERSVAQCHRSESAAMSDWQAVVTARAATAANASTAVPCVCVLGATASQPGHCYRTLTLH